MIDQDKIITKTSAYYNERGKFKIGPVFNQDKVWEGCIVMVYDYDRIKHLEATVTRVEPDIISYVFNSNKVEGTYSSAKAHEHVKGLSLPHVYLK